MNRFAAASFAFVFCAALAAKAFAAVNVGDKPNIDFQSTDGTHITSDALKGRLVLVDFWATWCGPCMAEAPHMVKVRDKYQERGLVIIGISLDDDKAKLLRVAQQSNFTWPQMFDGKGWENRMAKEWGVTGIPATFLLDPEGVVVWKGHPAQMDAPIEKAFAATPPRIIDPKLLASITTSLDEAERMLKDKKTAEALKAFSRIPADARSDGKLSARVDALQKELQGHADQAYTDADALIEKKDFANAVAQLKGLSNLKGLPIAQRAAGRLKELLAMPEVKAATEAAAKAQKDAEKAGKADEALAAARKLQADKKDEQAYNQFKTITTAYPNTPAAAAAEAEIKKYDADPIFTKKRIQALADSKAKGMLSVAASYKSAGKTDEARARYQAVLDQFPGTTYADQAKKELDKLK